MVDFIYKPQTTAAEIASIEKTSNLELALWKRLGKWKSLDSVIPIRAQISFLRLLKIPDRTCGFLVKLMSCIKSEELDLWILAAINLRWDKFNVLGKEGNFYDIIDFRGDEDLSEFISIMQKKVKVAKRQDGGLGLNPSDLTVIIDTWDEWAADPRRVNEGYKPILAYHEGARNELASYREALAAKEEWLLSIRGLAEEIDRANEEGLTYMERTPKNRLAREVSPIPGLMSSIEGMDRVLATPKGATPSSDYHRKSQSQQQYSRTPEASYSTRSRTATSSHRASATPANSSIEAMNMIRPLFGHSLGRKSSDTPSLNDFNNPSGRVSVEISSVGISKGEGRMEISRSTVDRSTAELKESQHHTSSTKRKLDTPRADMAHKRRHFDSSKDYDDDDAGFIAPDDNSPEKADQIQGIHSSTPSPQYHGPDLQRYLQTKTLMETFTSKEWSEFIPEGHVLNDMVKVYDQMLDLASEMKIAADEYRRKTLIALQALKKRYNDLEQALVEVRTARKELGLSPESEMRISKTEKLGIERKKKEMNEISAETDVVVLEMRVKIAEMDLEIARDRLRVSRVTKDDEYLLREDEYL